jgi:2-desacetyl-2-hydroxyethyl bacteriochlorophyllide A dehydrogenase
MPETMKAIVCRQPHDMGMENRPKPTRNPGEVTVKLDRIGICGTDYHIYDGKHPFLQYPRVMGHELAATVSAADSSSHFKPGQLVAINPYIACGKCHACKQGKPNCCMNIAVLGVHRDGGMCEFITLPEGNLLAADGMSADAAASVEFLAIGAHAVRRSGMGRGTKALVVGAGPIGLGAALFGLIAAGDVTIADRDPARLALASRITGIAQTILSDDSVQTKVMQATGDNGFDVVFDATGNGSSMEKSFDFVAHGGTYVLVGLVKNRISLSDPDFHKREMTLLASRNATAEDFELVMSAIRSGKIPISELITHRTKFEHVVETLPQWAYDKNGLIKAMIEIA